MSQPGILLFFNDIHDPLLRTLREAQSQTEVMIEKAVSQEHPASLALMAASGRNN